MVVVPEEGLELDRMEYVQLNSGTNLVFEKKDPFPSWIKFQHVYLHLHFINRHLVMSLVYTSRVQGTKPKKEPTTLGEKWLLAQSSPSKRKK